MGDIIRRKNTSVVSRDKKTPIEMEQQAVASWQKVVGGITGAVDKISEKKQSDYLSMIDSNIKSAQSRIANEKKAFDASDKLIAADRAGQLKNDLLRWNLTQRENNSTYIGTREHESAMRAEYDRLANKYNVGLGEVGMADFQQKTQGYVNTFLDNDIKWAYQQKIKQGEESAKASAQQIEQTAALHGANGDIQGFKDSYAEMSAPLGEYIGTASPENASKAMGELGQRSLASFVMGLAETDPVKAKAIIDSPENFKEVVPDEMLQTASDAMLKQQEEALKDQIILVNAGIENAKKGSPYYKELEKKKKELENGLKKLESADFGEESLESIRQSVGKTVEPIIEKAIGEKLLLDKQKAEEDKVEKFAAFVGLPTNINLDFSGKNGLLGNMPEFSKSPFATKKGLEELKKYKDSFSDVSMLEFSTYQGTKKMFDNLVALSELDADQDGNTDNVLMKALTALNDAKQEPISQKDYENYQNMVIKTLIDKSEKGKLKEFISATKNFLPKPFWTQGALLGSHTTRLTEEYEGRMRDVLSDTVAMFNRGDNGKDITDYYVNGMKNAYFDSISDAFGFDMRKVDKDFAEKGSAMVTVNGFQWYYKGLDSNGDAIWEPFAEHAKGVVKNKISELKNRFGSL